jgi:HEAT repeat protein
MKALIFVGLTSAILMPFVHGQDQQDVDGLLAQLKTSTIADGTIIKLQKYREPRVLTALREAFETHEEKQTRQYIAISLIRLGDKDQKYFHYIESFAKEAIDSDAPDMFVYGADGMALQAKWSAEFYEWSSKHGIPIESAVRQAYLAYPSDVMLFGEAEDPRCVELLKRGLQSQNPLIVAVSGHILAAMNDTGSIPLILQRINTSRATASEMLTDRIALFNGDQAERAIQTALVNPKLKERYRGLIEAKHKQPSSATH